MSAVGCGHLCIDKDVRGASVGVCGLRWTQAGTLDSRGRLSGVAANILVNHIPRFDQEVDRLLNVCI